METTQNIPNVKDYYDTSTRWYDWIYYDKKSLGLHYGFWETDRDKLENALTNQYKLVKELLNPQKGEKVLDAGCGVGGASIWLAENTKSVYEGITISEEQVKYANKYMESRRTEGRVNIHTGNYFNTEFSDNSFDGAFGIESMCYAYPKPLILYNEMYRILKPGGRFVISDGVYLRNPRGEEEIKISQDYCNGFKLVDMITSEEIIRNLTEAGFKNIRMIDKTREIGKSVEYIHRRSLIVSPFRFFKWLGLVTQTEVENLLATLNQKRMYEIGLFGYAVFYAEK